ncbi:MAG: killer suppression protein [Armatimonadota bacterium]|nr:killer suppression protein [Armatimonadota bacterium]
MKKVCSASKEQITEFGPERAKRLRRRLDQMRASPSLAVFRLVHPRCHSLIGNRAGQWSADLDGPYRLLFEIADEPLPVDDNGGINFNEVQKVRILDVTDTHQ